MDYGWFAYQCDSGETLFFYNKVSGEYRWLSCSCSKRVSAILAQDESNIGQPVIKDTSRDAGVRSIGTETDPPLPPLPTITKNFRTQGTQTDLKDLDPCATTIANNVCIEEIGPVEGMFSSGSLPSHSASLPLDERFPKARDMYCNRDTYRIGTYSKVKLYPCCFCKKAFTSYTFLTKHLKCHAILNDYQAQNGFQIKTDSINVEDIRGDSISLAVGQQRMDTTSERTAEPPAALSTVSHADVFKPLGFDDTKPLQCFQCSKNFTSSETLDDHFGLHYDELYCKACEKAFGCTKTFRQHLAVHFGEKHQCPHCSKKFALRLGLLRHIRFLHTSVWNDKLRNHLRQLEKPVTKSKEDTSISEQSSFKCDGCGQSFGLYSELVNHQKVCAKFQARNMKDKPKHPHPEYYKNRYWCFKCSRSYKTYKSFLRHKKRSKYHRRKEGEFRLNKFAKPQAKKPKATTSASHQECPNRSYSCLNCNLSFNDYKSLLQHKKQTLCTKTTRLDNNTYLCICCTDAFQSRADYARHLVTHISVDKNAAYPCNQCNKRLPNKCTLERHLYYHLQVHNCSHCNRTFKTFTDFKQHNKKVHSESTYFTCTVCSKQFLQSSGLSNHYKTHNEAGAGSCTGCGRTYHYFKNLQIHMRKCKKYRRKPYTERVSEEKESVEQAPKDGLIQHIKVEKVDDSYSINEGIPITTNPGQSSQNNDGISDDSNATPSNCPNLRDRKFVGREGYFARKETNFQCTKCHKFYSSKYALLRHQEVSRHKLQPTKGPMKRYKCQICRKAFHLYSVYYRHQRQHNNQRINTCRQCGASCATAKLLSLHKCIKSTPKASKSTKSTEETSNHFPCQLCNVVFSTKRGLCNHVRMHPKNIWECTCCNRVFENSRRLCKHKRTERHSQNMLKQKNNKPITETRLFECSSCAKFYKTLPLLLKHKGRTSCSTYTTQTSKGNTKSVIHCTVCDRSFRKYPLYQQHYSSTHGGIPCWLCPKHFSSFGNLRRHILEAHRQDKLYFCHYCSQEFSTLSNYTKHLGHSTSEKPQHLCKICRLEFSLCLYLTEHLKTHHHKTPDKP